jgi:hypothetical protein
MRTLHHATHNTPYCVIAQVCFGGVLRTMKVPEAQAPVLRQFGWSVIARDTDVNPREDAWTWRDLSAGPLAEWEDR